MDNIEKEEIKQSIKQKKNFIAVKPDYFTNLTPIAEGGEANVYLINQKLYKIYHGNEASLKERSKKLVDLLYFREILPENHRFGMPEKIIITLSQASKEIIPIGIEMTKIEGEEMSQVNNLDIVKKYNLNVKNILEMILYMRADLHLLHSNNIIIGDLNERNYLFNSNRLPYMIDVDSWAINDSKCDVIMPTYKDPKVEGNNFTRESDNFAFMIMTFKLLTRVHPYGGIHPEYRNKTPEKRILLNAHIINDKVKLPPNVRNLKVLSDKLLNKYKDFFEGKTRDIGDIFEEYYNELAYCKKCDDYYWVERNTCPICNSKGERIKTSFNSSKIFFPSKASNNMSIKPDQNQQIQTINIENDEYYFKPATIKNPWFINCYDNKFEIFMERESNVVDILETFQNFYILTNSNNQEYVLYKIDNNIRPPFKQILYYNSNSDVNSGKTEYLLKKNNIQTLNCISFSSYDNILYFEEIKYLPSEDIVIERKNIYNPEKYLHNQYFDLMKSKVIFDKITNQPYALLFTHITKEGLNIVTISLDDNSSSKYEIINKKILEIKLEKLEDYLVISDHLNISIIVKYSNEQYTTCFFTVHSSEILFKNKSYNYQNSKLKNVCLIGKSIAYITNDNKVCISRFDRDHTVKEKIYSDNNININQDSKLYYTDNKLYLIENQRSIYFLSKRKDN